VGLRPAAEHRGPAGHAPGRQRRLGGLCNTHFWIDRTSGIAASIYSSFLPFVPPEALQLYADFERALYAAR
jgi:hypothetical protein